MRDEEVLQIDNLTQQIRAQCTLIDKRCQFTPGLTFSVFTEFLKSNGALNPCPPDLESDSAEILQNWIDQKVAKQTALAKLTMEDRTILGIR